MRMILPSDCNSRIHTLRIDCKQAVSLSQPAMILSQPLCTYHNKRITYVVHSWYMGAHSTLLLWVLLCHSNHQLLFSQPHEDALTLGPPEKKQSYTKNYDALVSNINQARQSFSQWGFMPNRSMMACLIATDNVYVHHQCQQSIFPLK